MKILHPPIYFEEDLLSSPSFFETLNNFSGKFALITEKTVAGIYSASFLSWMTKQGYQCPLITFEGNERSKTRKTKEAIEDALLSKKLGKETLLIVMGGGVTTDLGGFVAATYLRGVPYLSIPTTLLAMVDASIGGKTGVNVKEGKNLIGAFYPPIAIFIDVSFLSTLPDAEILCAGAEILKYALVYDSDLFTELEDKADQWKSRNFSFLKKVMIQSIRIKETVVKKDPMETGFRRILNFGHTIGHAIETLEGSTVSHGQALALGMIVEGLIAHKMGHLDIADFEALYTLIQEMGFSLKISDRVTPLSMKQVMALDKKSQNARPRFVILDGIGNVRSYKGAYCISIENETLEEALGWMVAEFYR